MYVKRHVLMFFIHACFLILETCKIRSVCLSHIASLPSFTALFSCSLSNTELLFCTFWYCYEAGI